MVSLKTLSTDRKQSITSTRQHAIMLSLKTLLPYLHRSNSSFVSSLFLPRSTPRRPISVTMASTNVIEHIVLFKVRESTEPSKVDTMVTNLRALDSIGLTTYLTAGPILRQRSTAASAAGFTHLLHSRHRSKPDLADYYSHPSHLGCVKDDILPICDDVMAVDWVANIAGPVVPPPGSVIRLTVAKPKEGTAAGEVLDVFSEVEDAAGVQVSYGENFAPPENAKGYGVGFIAVFPGLEVIDAIDPEAVEAHKEKVGGLVESAIAMDYVIA